MKITKNIFLTLEYIDKPVSLKKLFKIIREMIIENSNNSLEKNIWISNEHASGKICLIEALREWVVIPKGYKREWCSKYVYKLLRKKLSVKMVILIARLIWSQRNI